MAGCDRAALGAPALRNGHDAWPAPMSAPTADMNRSLTRVRRCRRGCGCCCRRHVRLPTHERGPSDVRQGVDTALDPDKPAIDIPLQDLRGIGYAPLHVA